jgi:hypothetical protein
MSFRVFTASTPLFTSGEAKLLDKAIVVSFRDEINALGACTIELMLQNYSDSKFSENASQATTPFKVGDWVAIQNTEVIEPPDLTVARPEVAQEQYDRELNEPQCTDKSIVWWGYISSFQQEWSKDFKDYKGNISCYQFGHYLRSQQIDLKNTYKNGISNENGFNPILENGVVLGNFNGAEEPSSYGFLVSDPGTDPTIEKGKFWTVEQIFKFLARRCCPYAIDVDSSSIDKTKHNFFYNFESFPSYQGEDLIAVIDDMLEPLKVAFRITSTSYIEAHLVDPCAPKKDQNITYELSPSVFNFQITSEEQKYDKVTLRGDRILVSASMTTYKDKTKGWGLKRLWNDDKAKKYTKPLTFLDEPKNQEVAVDINAFQDKHSEALSLKLEDIEDEKAKEREQESTQEYMEYLLKTEDYARKKDKTTYQQFGWDFANAQGVSTSGGNYLYTCERPGEISFGNVFPVFPRVEFQKPYDENLVVVTGIIEQSILMTAPKITVGNLSAGEGEITTSVHETPPVSEFKFEEWIPVVNWATPDQGFTGNTNKNKPTALFARSIGIPAEFGANTYLQQVWYDITSPSFNTYSAEVELNWLGMKLNLPYPEVMGCPYDDIFRDPYSATSYTSVVDYGFQRNEWLSGTGASRFDPYRINFVGKTHWGRLVLSFSAYSNQKLELSYGKSNGKEKIIEDPSYKCFILRKGLVYNTRNFQNCISSQEKVYFPQVLNGLDYLTEDVVSRYDVPKMKDALILMYDYYTKDKKAIRIEDRIYDQEGKSKDLKVKVGDYWSKVKDGTSTLNTNSYVASIEYLLEKTGNPRVIIATEYPASPLRTRRRQIWWSRGAGKTDTPIRDNLK